ncbi:MAG TPA: hypothetical protein VMT23_00060 [Candidatus Binatia bacterium]|nr:hypothetical protein [Candidatus Binatia bacterium]
MPKIMTAQKLVNLYTELQSIGVNPILDGGWGVDALLGEETRPHKDADLIITKEDLAKVKDYLTSRGYKDRTEGEIWWHFFMDSSDDEIDFLVVDPQKSGGAYLGPRENDLFFPEEAFQGKGHVSGKEVACLSAPYRVRALTKEFGVVIKNNYQITEHDCRDMIALCKRFNIGIPSDYTDFMDSRGLAY